MAKAKAKIGVPMESARLGLAARDLGYLLDTISPEQMALIESKKMLSHGAFATWWRMLRADIESLAAL